MDASTNTTRVTPTSSLDRFLYAPIREDANGLMVTVLSALARQELDPWQEAAKLVKATRSNAIQRVTELIATLQSGPPVAESSREAAKRLVTLLPCEYAPDREYRSVEDPESNKIGFTMIGLMAMLIVQWLIFRDAVSDIPEESSTPTPVAAAPPVDESLRN